MTEKSQNHTKKIILGCENFLSDYLDLVKGKRVGLITNPTGLDSQLNSLIDLFFENSHIDLVALFGPEHGIDGHSQAGVYVPYSRDKKYGLPVFSLYGQSMEAAPEKSKNEDEQMRSFDTVETGKLLETSMVENVDVLIFDVQDIGTRIYTYAATMAYSMQDCAEKGIDFIVFDRPGIVNPPGLFP